MEIVGSEKVTVTVNNGEKGGISLTAEGNMSVCEIELPEDSNAFVSFICNTPCQWDYALASFHLGMKALSVASETYIRVNSEGMMCIQHLLETDMGEDTTIDFILVSSEDIERTTQTPHHHSPGEGGSNSHMNNYVRPDVFTECENNFADGDDDEDDAGYDDYTR